MEEVERETILAALKHYDGNRTHTAKALKMGLRTVRHKLGVYESQGHKVERPKLGVPIYWGMEE